MTTLPSNPRYERKFVTDRLALSEVLALVRRHPAGFRETYPARSVNNLYLDSPEFRDYHDHINGVARRTKTRLRWYGAWAGCITSPTLEQKLKSGLVSGKVSHRLPPLSMNGHVSRPDLEAAFDSANLPALARFALHHLQPSLLNRYQRHYFQSADGRFRLTVDSDLQFAAARQAQGMGGDRTEVRPRRGRICCTGDERPALPPRPVLEIRPRSRQTGRILNPGPERTPVRQATATAATSPRSSRRPSAAPRSWSRCWTLILKWQRWMSRPHSWTSCSRSSTNQRNSPVRV